VRRLARLATPVAVLALLTGCGANFDAQTNRPYQPAEGTNDRSNGVYVLNTLAVTDGEGNATIVSRLVNQQDVEDQLLSFAVTTLDEEPVEAAPLEAPVELAVAPWPEQSVQVGTEGLLRISGDNFEAGDFLVIGFTFAQSEPVEMQIPVVEPGTEYGDIPVGEVVTDDTAAE
jgi:hypothetical protein